VVLYELLSDRQAFGANSAVATMTAVIHALRKYFLLDTSQ
jgi:hypothetical protein